MSRKAGVPSRRSPASADLEEGRLEGPRVLAEPESPSARCARAGDVMRALVVLMIYLIGVGVALAPTIRAKWNSVSAADFAMSVGQELPGAFAWPVTFYRSITEG